MPYEYSIDPIIPVDAPAPPSLYRSASSISASDRYAVSNAIGPALREAEVEDGELEEGDSEEGDSGASANEEEVEEEFEVQALLSGRQLVIDSLRSGNAEDFEAPAERVPTPFMLEQVMPRHGGIVANPFLANAESAIRRIRYIYAEKALRLQEIDASSLAHLSPQQLDQLGTDLHNRLSSVAPIPRHVARQNGTPVNGGQPVDAVLRPWNVNHCQRFVRLMSDCDDLRERWDLRHQSEAVRTFGATMIYTLGFLGMGTTGFWDERDVADALRLTYQGGMCLFPEIAESLPENG